MENGLFKCVLYKYCSCVSGVPPRPFSGEFNNPLNLPFHLPMAQNVGMTFFFFKLGVKGVDVCNSQSSIYFPHSESFSKLTKRKVMFFFFFNCQVLFFSSMKLKMLIGFHHSIPACEFNCKNMPSQSDFLCHLQERRVSTVALYFASFRIFALACLAVKKTEEEQKKPQHFN